MRQKFLAVILVSSPTLFAQVSSMAPAPGARSFPECVSKVADASGGACLEASSVATSGRLFPYPGIDNVFTGPAVVSGGWMNSAPGVYSTIAGGYLNTAAGRNSVIGGGLGNSASENSSTIAGGGFNIASGFSATVGGGNGNGASGWRSTVGGGGNNTASDSGATVGGGVLNEASGKYSTVGGGEVNDASGIYSTVSGGRSNVASGARATIGGGGANDAMASYSTIGGGSFNSAVGHESTVSGGRRGMASGTYSALGGGRYNTASGDLSTVGGGSFNTASGPYGMVLGGAGVLAAGSFSCAAGNRAKATHDGAFVWGDSVNVDKTSSAPDEFSIYADGGMRIFTNGTASSSLTVLPVTGNVGIGTASPSEKLQVVGNICATGAITVCSDQRYKESVEPLSDALETVLAMRGVSYDWKTEEFPEQKFVQQRQIGFLAQELLQIVPEVVSEGSDGYYAVDYGKLTPLLVEALKELAGDNARLREETARLQREQEAQLAAVIGRLSRLELGDVKRAED